jgi:hypothetical protein
VTILIGTKSSTHPDPVEYVTTGSSKHAGMVNEATAEADFRADVGPDVGADVGTDVGPEVGA